MLTKKQFFTFSTYFLAVALLMLLAACAGKPQKLKQVYDDPNVMVGSFEREIANARSNQLDLLAPTWFGKAEDSLKDAKVALAKKADVSLIAGEVSRGRAELEKAREIADVARSSLADVIQRREMARKAGATQLSGYGGTEEDFQRLIREIERENLGYVNRNKNEVAESYHKLEIDAIKRNVLGDVRLILQKARKEEAEEFAPQVYAEAVNKLRATDRFITSNPYESEKINRMANDALFYAQRTIVLTAQSKKIEKMTPEQIALWIESILQSTTSQLSAPDMRNQDFQIQMDNIIGSIKAADENLKFLNGTLNEQRAEIETLNTSLAALEGKSRQEQLANERLEAEKRFNEKFLRIQKMFSRSEAEVYRQGNELVIRLRGMAFPVGSAVIMPDNYSLLSKVQQAIRTFDAAGITIEGHTDSTGSEEVNRQLSEDRAASVQKYLIANGTSPEERIIAIGYGASRPLMPNNTAAGRAANRRIDLVISPAKEGS